MRSWVGLGFPSSWQRRDVLAYGLRPFSWIFQAIALIRRGVYRCLPSKKFPFPIIIVGNLTVGGTGKTPFVIWLANILREQGYTPGIVTRGYKGQITKHRTILVDETSQAIDVGDEAILLCKHAGCPVVAGRRRRAAVDFLTRLYPQTDVIISDDGLQHYALSRTVEIVIMDGLRRWGNGFCLPAGPLREPLSRLKTVDFVISNGREANEAQWCMKTSLGSELFSLKSGIAMRSLQSLVGKTVHAVAGIGDPSKFFNALAAMGINVIKHPFPDHYHYQERDLIFNDDYPILMTEKDAVKCHTFNLKQAWVVYLEIFLPEECINNIMGRLTNGRKIT